MTTRLLERLHPRRSWSSLVVVALLATTLYFVFRSDGNIVPELDLHDAGIWVTNESSKRVGRTNTEIEVVDTALDAQASPFDVLQDGPVVLLRQLSPSRLAGIDPTTSEVIPGPEIPEDAQVGLGGGTAALFDPRSGELFVAPAPNSSAGLAVDPSAETGGVLAIEGAGRLAVGVDGLVHLLAVETGEITTLTADGEVLTTRSVSGDDLDESTLTAVGSTPVVSTPTTVLIPGRRPVDVGSLGDAIRVQEPGPATHSVLLAGDGSFARVSMSGGDPRSIDGAGRGVPARPVFVAGCAYGAWGSDLAYVQLCDGARPRTGEIPELEPGELRFRVNRNRVTLNNLDNGRQLLFGEDDPIFIDNQWAEALTDEVDEEPEVDETADVQVDPACSEDNTDPVAEPDEGIFGTRAGRPVVVYPLLNDSDPDCDVLLIDSATPTDPASGTVGIVESGRAVQVALAPGETSMRFDYSISDGRGGEASSFVTVALVPDDRNAPPKLSLDEETTVVTGGTVTHNILAPAYDPDGDVLRLKSATIEDTAAGTVRFTEKGDITFTATDTLGVTEVTYVVGDGDAESTAVLRVKVVDRNTNQPPNARKDSATTFVGREVVLDVLDNDTDPDGDTLSLARVVADGDASVSWDPTSPEIRVVSDRASTVNVTYRITDGRGGTDETVFRVDVRDEIENLPPVAVRDDVLLTAGIPAYVPVVENDVDPDGSVLVVLGIEELPEPSPITVTVLQRAVLKISTPTPLTEAVTFSYRISDGSNEAVGSVLVEPAEPNAENRPPVATPDEFTVRAGGIASLPVLANDSDPDADPISVVAPPADQPDATMDGRLFLAPDGQLRYEAPTTPRSTIRLIYSVEDTAANVSSAELTVHVLSADDDQNEAPIAPELIGRTVAGQPVTVKVPITTMDPDGDAVTFLGLDDAAQLGTVTAIRPDEFVYIPDESSAGTDEFSYRVVDSFGQEATGTILIGVAGRSMVNNRPIPVDDEVSVRPGATVRVPVLNNDADPDGDPLSISTADEDLPLAGQGSVTVDGRDVRYTAPDQPDGEETSFRYVVSDGRGLTRGATVTVTFRTDDNNQPPEAADDTTTPQVPETVATLDLLANDEDPDQDELTIIDVSRPEVTIAADGRSVEVTVPTEPLQFTYLISDGEATSRAAVFVPVVDPDSDLPPIARLDDDIEVDLGESVTIDVLDNDEDPEGADLHLLEILEPVRHGSVDFDGNDVVFTATEENYAGDAGFYYLVGDSDDRASANTAVGAVHIRVTGQVNTPPGFVQLTVEVPAGSERQLDLTTGVVDPDRDDDHSFEDLSIDADADGIDVDIDDDGTMTVSASSDTPPESSALTTFTVADDHDEVEGSVLVTVVSSDRPLAVVGPDDAETVQSVPVTVDVLANDTNPFPETPLQIVDVGSPTGGGSARSDGGSIVFDPGDWFGTSTITYRVADETGDPAREVEGTLTVNVIGFPDAPPAPTCIGGESRTVRVQWAAPSANGAPITNYVVRVSGAGSGAGDRTVSSASTVDIGGLTNGVDYTFQVGAVNEATEEAGVEPQFSPASPPCTPDQVPDQPAAPVTQFGDRQIAISWTAPNNEGSALQGYTLYNATNGESKQFGPSETGHTWTGLENGTCYRFTLVATNALGDSDPSAPSAGDQQTCVPAGVPQNPSTPTITNNQPGQRDGVLNVAWTWNNSTQGNGADVTAFRITQFRNGAQDSVRTITNGSARTATFNGLDNGQTYTYTLEAMNKAGWSARSPRSATAVPAGLPGAPPKPGVAPEPNSGQVRLSFAAPADNGAAITAYQYSTDGGSSWRALDSSRVISSLSNGTSYRFNVRARNSEGWGPASTRSDAVAPFGKVMSPTGLNGSQGSTTLRWTWNSLNNTRLNGHNNVVRYEVSVGGGSWQGNSTSTSYSMNVSAGECRNVRVRAIGNRQGSGANDNRHIGDATSGVQACAPAPPQPSLTIFPTAQEIPCDIGNGPCDQYSVRGSNLPGGSITVHCQFRNPGSGWGSNQFTWRPANNGGSFSATGNCHVGTNTDLRYVVNVGGQTFYSCARTKDQGSCTT